MKSSSINSNPRAINQLPDRYLELFCQLKNPPQKLFYKGDKTLLNRRKIAIVGTRRASQYAINSTKLIAQKLSSLGCVVVSGAAMGIDAAAHIGAGQSTIAVFGNSLDRIYPSVNRSLIEKIYSQSLALSEYELDTAPTSYSFVLRNRLVVSMSEAVIISEADENGGSMRSAEIAIKLGRPIYVLPHRLGESKGTAKLLANSLATPIYDLDVFVASLGLSSLVPNDEIRDPLMEFCAFERSFDDVFAVFGEKLYEYELEGKIEIVNNRVIIKPI